MSRYLCLCPHRPNFFLNLSPRLYSEFKSRNAPVSPMDWIGFVLSICVPLFSDVFPFDSQRSPKKERAILWDADSFHFLSIAFIPCFPSPLFHPCSLSAFYFIVVVYTYIVLFFFYFSRSSQTRYLYSRPHLIYLYFPSRIISGPPQFHSFCLCCSFAFISTLPVIIFLAVGHVTRRRFRQENSSLLSRRPRFCFCCCRPASLP